MKPPTKALPLFLAFLFSLSMFGLLFWNLSQTKPVYAAAIIVNTAADEYNSDGDCSLREAIASANLDTAVDACTPGNDSDEIQFSLATPTIITLTLGQIAIQNDPLTLTGPGAAQLAISGNDTSRIFDIAVNVPVTITGLTLQDGWTTVDGGAIRSDNALTLRDSVLVNNSAGSDGGAIDIDGNLTLENTDILSNTANGEGGGINAFGAQTTVLNGRFQNNQSGSYGGGIYAYGAIEIDGTEFINNTAQLYAGAVWAWNEATVANATFTQNQALNLSAGAMYVRYDVQIADSTFGSNTAAQNIGAVWASQNATITSTTFNNNMAGTGRSAALQVHGTLWLTNTQWIGNQSAVPGGALMFLGEDGRIVNSLFARNVGGAASLEHSGAVELLHTTIVGPDSPAASALAIDSSGTVLAQNSIFSGYLQAFNVITGTVTEDYNLFYNTVPVSGTVSQGSHSYEGNPAFVDEANDDYHLSANSMALNTGSDVGLSADIDGDSRPGGSGIDLGVDETTYVADVSLTKAAFSSPGPNQPISYTLTFANVGSAMLPYLTLTDHLPAQVVAPIEISSSVPVSDVSGETLYTWQVENLAPGASGVITISGVLSDVLPHGLITNTATIASTASETNLANNVAQATITVPNIGPVAIDDVMTISEDETVTLSPLANDIDGDVLAIESFTPPGHGTAVLSGTQQLVYTPTLEFSGQDSFSYVVSDGESSDTAVITITVIAENDAPIISEGEVISQTISEDNDPTAFSLTLNATDAENSPLSWSITGQPAHGMASTVLNPAPSSEITYEPSANYFGSDQFQVQVTDGALTDIITINLTIEPVNDAPVGVDDYAVVLRRPSGNTEVLATGSTGSLNLLDNDTDVENASLTMSNFGSPDRGGTVNVSSDGTLQTYEPASSFVGVETFIYTVDDGDLDDTATVYLNVVEGADGGIGGDSFSVSNLGEDNTFNVGTQMPANVANGANFALIFNQTGAGSAVEVNVPPASPPAGYVPAGLTFSLLPYVAGQAMAESYQFAEPITLIVTYPDAAVADIGPSENSLSLYFQSLSGWSDNGVQIVERDLVNHRLVLTVNHGGTFSLFHLGFVYIPLVTNNYFQAPDLIVESVTVLEPGAKGTPGNVQVVIKNVGNAAVTDEFWVDLYINPHVVPTAVNQTWEMVGTQGAAWGVLADALPLNPGASLTLSLSSPYYAASSSHIVWPLAASAQLYVQVDSNNPGNDNGAVLEYHEINGNPYNNIFGPN